MESPRKFNDCYFYYYSTCTKGDNCVFRHEPSALGCETMCTAWQQGKCLDKHCKLRHMELRKNRKQIPCYWENQPGGCRKKHCPFMHKNPDARTDGIAPSQPGPIPTSPSTSSIPEASAEQAITGVPTPNVPPPASVPLLWPQRQVLDSAILGVLPASPELLGGRRVVAHGHPHAHAHAHPHAHAHAVAHAPHEAYAPLPVDPLVVNFEEESDNESAPSSTPTKADVPEADDPAKIARTKSQELLLLEKIQAESAAYYNYDALDITNERKKVRANLSTKYDKISLDEIAGKQTAGDMRTSLDFKVLSLDEIRAKKKVSDTVIQPTPITLTLNRKRKLSSHEAITTAGNKIIKLVRNNSIVYKKLDKGAPTQPSQTQKAEVKKAEVVSRKRTLSEQSDMSVMQADELVDNCYEFKRIKIAQQTSKPRLIRSRSSNKSTSESKDIDESSKCEDSDSEVQIVSVDLSDDKTCDSDIIDLESTNIGEPVDVVDLCDDPEDNEITVADLELDLVKNVPDVVASCQKSANKENDKDILNDIDAILNENL